jgi:hypothetical protein
MPAANPSRWPAPRGAVPRLCPSGNRQGNSLRRVRCRAPSRVGRCRAGPRYGAVYGPPDRALVAGAGARPVSRRPGPVHGGGRRRRSGSQVRLWKLELQRFATASGLRIHVSHVPPGTRKRNAIEHRLFSVIRMHGRGRPLTPCETVVEWIGHTTTATGLTVWAEWDPGVYPTGLRVTAAQMRALHLEPDAFHGQWNYTISPESVSSING